MLRVLYLSAIVRYLSVFIVVSNTFKPSATVSVFLGVIPISPVPVICSWVI